MFNRLKGHSLTPYLLQLDMMPLTLTTNDWWHCFYCMDRMKGYSLTPYLPCLLKVFVITMKETLTQ